MIRAAALLDLAFCLFACALAAGCAAPGEPTARHPVVPVAVTDLAARQYGSAFALTFTLPARSMDREALAEHPTIEIYRAALSPGVTPDKKTAWRLAYSIPSEQVDPYLKAGHIEFRDPLTADDFARAAGSSMAYKVRTRAAKKRASEDSNVVLARIYPAPEAPRDVRVDVTESAVVVNWAEAALPPGASSRVYRVYRGGIEFSQENPPQDVSMAKLKTPLELAGTSPSAEFRDSHFEFGTPYLYTVRSVAQFGADFAESADSAPAMVTPRDVFPPAAPTNLEITIIPATNQAPAYIELSWAISPEGDLAGYSVYRSEGEDAPGERVSTEILPSPTFRDISVMLGRRYYYRVSALDRTG
ncbi:MAG TPA: fibronectin type III domain-containing protein, partial [Candidatus Acidoferrales bacterium]|nr:fibronectin type III domain-containing protein [Candidatus Acidoferrales bacterium]